MYSAATALQETEPEHLAGTYTVSDTHEVPALDGARGPASLCGDQLVRIRRDERACGAGRGAGDRRGRRNGGRSGDAACVAAVGPQRAGTEGAGQELCGL